VKAINCSRNHCISQQHICAVASIEYLSRKTALREHCELQLRPHAYQKHFSNCSRIIKIYIWENPIGCEHWTVSECMIGRVLQTWVHWPWDPVRPSILVTCKFIITLLVKTYKKTFQINRYFEYIISCKK